MSPSSLLISWNYEGIVSIEKMIKHIFNFSRMGHRLKFSVYSLIKVKFSTRCQISPSSFKLHLLRAETLQNAKSRNENASIPRCMQKSSARRKTLQSAVKALTRLLIKQHERYTY